MRPSYIVLIDDDAEDIEFMKLAIHGLLPNAECQVFLYPDEAWKTISSMNANELPDHIFIDINMPGFTGDRLLKKIRKKSDLNEVKISLYSTSIPEEVSEALRAEGADFVFQKPTRIKDYLDTLKPILLVDRTLINAAKDIA